MFERNISLDIRVKEKEECNAKQVVSSICNSRKF
jgi:hypothetical protein